MADSVAIERLKEVFLAKFGRTLDSHTDYDLLPSAIERIRRMCERVRGQRSDLDFFEYNKLINSEYYPILFATISGYIKERCDKEFDKVEAEGVYGEIFSASQNLAIELHRESSAELNEAIFGSPYGPAQPKNQFAR